jgi:hypothetical protein
VTCPTCGGALAAAGATCTVCNPWAVPASDGVPGAAALPPPAQFAAPPLPKWLTRLIKRNPPAVADLDKALRNSVISWTMSGVYLLALVILLFVEAEAVSSSDTGSLGAVLGVLVVMLLVFSVVGLTLRKRTWLPRAVAAVGMRPDVGYYWFAGIPQLVRRNKLLQSMRVIVLVFVVGRVALAQNATNETAAQLVWFACYFLVAFGMFVATIVLEVGAADVVRTRLSRPAGPQTWPVQPSSEAALGGQTTV